MEEIKKIKEAFSAFYRENGDIEKAERIEQSKEEYVPIFQPANIHPEEEPDLTDINGRILDIAGDFKALNNELARAAEKCRMLLEDAMARLGSVVEKIEKEEERLEDLSRLASLYDSFHSVKTLTAEDFNGDFTFDSGAFLSRVQRTIKSGADVLAVDGNGNVSEAAPLDHLFDDDPYTYFAYVCQDRKGAEAEAPVCTLTLRTDHPVNKMKIASDMDGVAVYDLKVSKDGSLYQSVLSEPLYLNDRIRKYDNPGYVYGSGLLFFPETQYVKITFLGGETRDGQAEESF